MSTKVGQRIEIITKPSMYEIRYEGKTEEKVVKATIIKVDSNKGRILAKKDTGGSIWLDEH